MSRPPSYCTSVWRKRYSIKALEGSFLSMGKRIDSENRTFPVLYEFKNPEKRFKIGSLAEVELAVHEPKNVLSVPNEAIHTINGLTYVYMQTDGEHFIETQVNTGISSGGYTEILTGIQEGVHVVTVGSYQVRLASLKTSEIATHTH